jgi:hypothetical protein
MNKRRFEILGECKLHHIEVFGESNREIQQNNKNTISRASELSAIMFMTFA